MKAVVIDTETTGLEEPEIVQVAYCGVGSTAIVTKMFRPSKPIQFGALATHHILPADVEDCPPSSEFRLPDTVEYLIGFNVDFDWEAIGKPATKQIDLMAISRVLYESCDSHKQTAIAYFLFGVSDETRDLVFASHGAYSDCYVATKILERIMADTKITDMAALFAYSQDCRIPRKMTFGKHLGKAVSEVDDGYRRWYSNTDEPDQWVLKAFQRFPYKK